MARTSKYGENTRSVNLTLTPTAIANLEAMATRLGISSKSELVEQIARGILPPDPMELNLQQLGEPCAV